MGKNKGGRPTLYSEKNKNKAIAFAEAGATDAEICEVIGISPATLYAWKGRYPEFIEALKEAKEIPNKAVEAALFRSAMGYTHVEEKIFFYKGKVKRIPVEKHYPPNPTSMIFWLKNRDPKAWREALEFHAGQNPDVQSGKKKTFSEFCETASYPKPYPKQIEMFEFGMLNREARILLGARGVGKTDYVVILGIAYLIYLDPINFSTLLITKSEERNSAILAEIAMACKANGVHFEKENSECIRARGKLKKDHSVSAVTIGTKTLRGRHPKLVVMDDPVTEDDVSPSTRAKVQRVYNEAFKLCANILVIGQPVHKQDLYEKLRPLLKKMEVPHGAIPELDHDLEAQRAAGVSEESIQASYFLKVISENASPFDNVKYLDKFPEAETAVAWIDPSFKGGDFTALTIMKAHFDGMAVFGKVYKKAWNHCIEDMVAQLKANKVKRVAFECNSLGDQPVIMLRQMLATSGIGVVGIDSTDNKHARIMNAGSFAHLIYLCKTSDRAYIDQVVQYEYGVKNDDAPDSLASCLKWLGLIRGK